MSVLIMLHPCVWYHTHYHTIPSAAIVSSEMNVREQHRIEAAHQTAGGPYIGQGGLISGKRGYDTEIAASSQTAPIYK